MVVGILFEMEEVTVAKLDIGRRGSKFEHVRVSAVYVRDGTSKTEYFAGRDTLKKASFGNVVNYHSLVADFQLSGKMVQNGKITSGFIQDSNPSYARKDKVSSYRVCSNADAVEHYWPYFDWKSHSGLPLNTSHAAK